eukprot:6210050-Pleurochrysis_carterae.AAC.4
MRGMERGALPGAIRDACTCPMQGTGFEMQYTSHISTIVDATPDGHDSVSESFFSDDRYSASRQHSFDDGLIDRTLLASAW